MHSTSNLEDGYMGSGKRLRYSIRKHGVENHTREILEFLDDRESLAKREAEIVNEELINDTLCMNLKVGGFGGFSNEEHQRKCSLAGASSPGRTKKSTETLRKLLTDEAYRIEYCAKISKGLQNKPGNFGMLGKKHSKESIDKMKLYASHNNSQYGTCWITNEVENRKIKKGDLIPDGWKLGRILKNR